MPIWAVICSSSASPCPDRASGGARTILATRFGGVCFFLFGFEKNERDNASPRELALYRRLAAELLGLSDAQIAAALAGEVLTEVRL